MINCKEVFCLMPPEEVINLRCEAALEGLKDQGVPLTCYSIWPRSAVIGLGGKFFTHWIVSEGKSLWIGEDTVRLAKIDAGYLEAPLKDFVARHPDAGLRIERNKRVITFDFERRDLSGEQRKVYGELKGLMDSLVEGSKEFVVDSYDTGIAILRSDHLAFEAANARLGWKDMVHLVITDELGEQSICEGAQVSLCVGEGRRVNDANALADVLEWLLLLFRERKPV